MQGKYTLLKCGKLFDGIHDELQPDMEILISGNRIAKVGRNLEVPEDIQTVDLRHLTVTPGMIDAHIHMHYADWRTRKDEILFASPEYKTLSALKTAQSTLERGFTSVRQVGLNAYEGYGIVDVRRVIERGYFPGSRIKCCPMYLTTRGGSGDQPWGAISNPWLADRIAERYPTIGCGADQFSDIVRQLVKNGADFIKMMVSGSFMGQKSCPEDFDYSDEELLAIFSTAHRLKKKCTAHAYADLTVRHLVELGIDGIEHGALITQDTIRLMEEKDVYIVPTFTPYEEIFSMDPDELSKSPEWFRKKLEYYRPQLLETRELLKNSKLRMGFGSDIVKIHQCYESGYEYRSWMRSGFDPFRILKAATSVNAQILEMPDVGVIAEGYLADIAAWRRDLLTDENALLDCAFVMKDGVIYPAVSALEEKD